MSDISKAYDPSEVESTWYQRWMDAGAFRGEADPEKAPFCITIPPPNVTGVLHMGHLMNNAIQDIYTRRARQQGKAAVWVPGTDHAGIATQSRVEKELRKEGKTRHDLGREKFVELASEWRDDHRNIILDQLKKLGASCDWDRTVHTLDDDYSHAVLTAFVKLFQSGKIYRGQRMVNWCPVSLTALSDEEVIMKPQSGLLYKMRYEVAERPGEFVEISTTRPETIMGDTGVAIHPEDDRYKHLHGLHAVRPFPQANIPFVLDEYVDREFGTGVLKVTPAHDRADWDIGQRHGLEAIDVLTPDGKVNCEACPDLHGKDRFEARKLAVKKLEELSLLVESEQYENNVGFSERADVPIEPRLSDQWWLKYPKVAEAKAAVAEGKIKFYPERWAKTYDYWLDNIQDWCISRQLWWGHRIPVWYRKGIDRAALTEEDLRDPSKVHVSVEGPPDPENWDQEEDVLDTWASSWLWPFGVFGWPHGQGNAECGTRSEELDNPQSAIANLKSKELAYWHPTSLLVTGPDIIFFWVARMIMAGLEFMDEIPFQAVYFTGLIRDEKGRKMSKSLGNSPDALELISRFGADGLRLGLLMIAPKGQDILFSEERVQQGRNFCNKLWNACRFRQGSADKLGFTGQKSEGSLETIIAQLDKEVFDADDHAILGRLCLTLDRVDDLMSRYELTAACQELYVFFWTDFCDWYVEVSKAKLEDKTLVGNCFAIQDICLRQVLLMLHPIIPFITEQLWHDLGFADKSKGEIDSIENYGPGTGVELRKQLSGNGIELDENAIATIDAIREFVSQARAQKAQYNLAVKKDSIFYLEASEAGTKTLNANKDKLLKLVGAQEIELKSGVEDAPAVVTPLGTLYLDLASAVDPEAEKARLNKELIKLDKAIGGAEKKLANENYTSKAPAEVVAGVRETLEGNIQKKAELERLLKGLG